MSPSQLLKTRVIQYASPISDKAKEGPRAQELQNRLTAKAVEKAVKDVTLKHEAELQRAVKIANTAAKSALVAFAERATQCKRFFNFCWNLMGHL